jgi:ADP-L-glycero-D-manno-heptose 6-epimerase
VIFHLGAITDTAETNESKLATWNTRYSQMLWNLAAHHGSNLIYASSAATYGDGRLGYSDDHGRLSELRPLNAYGWSKQRFDVWALSQPSGPPFWVGWKFFNVYGPGESHKGRMASVVWHASKQLREKGVIELFRSHRHDVADGKQKRDFVFVDDVVDRLLACIAPPKEIPSGIYNLGTGKARTFLDVATGVATALNHPLKVEWIETPPEFREHYQYWTQADMEKAHAAGFSSTYTPLASGIRASLAT